MSLTEDESRAMNLTSQLANLITENILTQGDQHAQDRSEVVSHVHALQNMILSQVARRQYPTTFRPLGGDLPVVCSACNGERWIPDLKHHDDELRPGHGLIPCPVCSPNDWSAPWPR